MKDIHWHKFFRIFIFLAALAVFFAATNEIYQRAWVTGTWIGKLSQKWALTFAGFELIFLVWLGIVAAFLWPTRSVKNLQSTLVVWRNQIGWLRWAFVVGGLIFLPWFFLYTPSAFLFTGYFIRLIFYTYVVGVVAVLLTRTTDDMATWNAIAAAGVLVGSSFVLGDLFTLVTAYPFKLYWSEGNRFWDYSMFFGADLYQSVPDAAIIVAPSQPGRPALYGLPFLFTEVSIRGMRFWNALMFSVPAMIFGWVVFRSQKTPPSTLILLGLWAFMFLNQGPIWTPLVIVAILVASVNHSSLWISIPVMVFAGFFANVSRFTWSFAPSMWIAMLLFGEVQLNRGLWNAQVWRKTITLVAAGLVGAFVLEIPESFYFLDEQIPIGESNVAINSAANGIIDIILRTLSQHKLEWSRLLPNPTYGAGIILGIALVTFPLIWLMISLLRGRKWQPRLDQIVVLGGALLAFLVVGLIISTKVGGGTNLHNLDMFFIGLVFTAALVLRPLNKPISLLLRQSILTRALILLAIYIPVHQSLVLARPLDLPPEEETSQALQTIQDYVSCAAAHGEVLFLDERQLLTFGFVEPIPLVMEYEMKYVMDEAMEGDADYFNVFYTDLDEGRFSLIVSEWLKVNYQDSTAGLSFENNAWVKWVSEPILQRYNEVVVFKSIGVGLYMPKNISYQCP